MRMIAALVFVAGVCAGCGKNTGKEFEQGSNGQLGKQAETDRRPEEMSEMELRKEYAKCLDDLDKINLLAAEICSDKKNEAAVLKQNRELGYVTPSAIPEDPRTKKWSQMHGELILKSNLFRNQWLSIGLKHPEFKPFK